MTARNLRYDSTHDAERAAWAPIVAQGVVSCRRGPACRAPQLLILPGEPWDLGHPDAACRAPKAPEHEACNRATATHKAEARRRPPEAHPGRRPRQGVATTPSPTPSAKGQRA